MDLNLNVKEKKAAIDEFNEIMNQEVQVLLSTDTPSKSGNSLLEDYRLFCIKEKSIYATLNLCSGEVLLRVNCWYPSEDYESIQGALSSVSSGTGQGGRLVQDRSSLGGSPPTFIRTNEFTEA